MNRHQEAGRPRLSFGEFTLDAEAGKLFRGGETILLRPQPFELLHLLASSGGRLVTREEIRAALWEDDTFVDHDTGINSCIRQIRRALDDDREVPCYVETVPRRGYRFVAPVEPVGTSTPMESDRDSRMLGAPMVLVALLVLAWGSAWLPDLWTSSADVPTIRLENPVRLTSAPGVESYPAWSPDGRLLAYSTQSDAMMVHDTHVWVVPIAGGDPLNRTADYIGINNFPSWRPNGNELTFVSDRDGPGIYAMPALAGSARKLIDVGDVIVRTSPALWSSDGKRAAVSSADENGPYVEIITLANGNSRRVSMPTAGYYFDLSWSPDERFFAYIATGNRRTIQTSVRIVRISDGESFRITESDTTEWNPSWSSDSRTIYFVSNRGGTMDLWQQRLNDGGAPIGESEPITSGLEIRRAAFSPAGDRLAYVKGAWISNLWRVPVLPDRPATWADAEQLTFDRNFIRNVAVSADGRRVAVISNRGGVDNVWLVDEKGILKPVTTDEIGVQGIDWSRDGKTLLFGLQSGDRDIWTVPAAGGAPIRVTWHERSDSLPQWSPDGRRVVFVSSRSGKGEIWVTSLDTGGARRLTDTSDIIWWPDWSPDGAWLSYMAYRASTGPRLEKVPVDGGDPVRITNIPIWKHVWANDDEIYFISVLKPEAGNIWSVSVEDGNARMMTDLSGKPGTLGGEALDTDGEYIYFTWEEDLGDIWLMDVVK